MMINEDIYARLKPEEIPHIISKYQPPFKDYDEVMKEQEQLGEERESLKLKASQKPVLT